MHRLFFSFVLFALFIISCTDQEDIVVIPKMSETELNRDSDIQNLYTRIEPYLLDKNSDMSFICVPDIHAGFECITDYHLPFLTETSGFDGHCRIMISQGDILYDGNSGVSKKKIMDEYVPRYQNMVKSITEHGFLFLGGLGGHDFNEIDKNGCRDYSISNNLTKAQQRSSFIQPCLDAISNNEALLNRYTFNIPADEDACYYYVDDNITGHRIIMLDETDHPQISKDGVNLIYDTYSTAFYKEEQLKWLVSALKTTPSGKYVIVNNHMGLRYYGTDESGTVNAVIQILTAFVNKEILPEMKGTDSNGYSWSLPGADFSLCKGIFAGLYNGHVHAQEYNVVNHCIPQISSTNPDSYPYRSVNNETYKIPYTGDLYVISDKEIRNFHYGRTYERNANTGEWTNNKYSDRWLDDPIILK